MRPAKASNLYACSVCSVPDKTPPFVLPSRARSEAPVAVEPLEEAATKEQPEEVEETPPIPTGVISFFNPMWGVKTQSIHLGEHLDGAAIEPVAPQIVEKHLNYPDFRVRRAALEALGRLDPSALEAFADAITSKLEDTNASVRQAAKAAADKVQFATKVLN